MRGSRQAPSRQERKSMHIGTQGCPQKTRSLLPNLIPSTPSISASGLAFTRSRGPPFPRSGLINLIQDNKHTYQPFLNACPKYLPSDGASRRDGLTTPRVRSRGSALAGATVQCQFQEMRIEIPVSGWYWFRSQLHLRTALKQGRHTHT